METNKQIPDEVVNKLRAPLPKEAVKPHPTKDYLSTIKVIYEHERLNEVFGLNGWRDTYEIVTREGKMVVVKGHLSIPAYGIEREAFGGNDNPDLGDAFKGACTDALSKMCSSIYIGMDVYKGLENNPLPKFAKAPTAVTAVQPTPKQAAAPRPEQPKPPALPTQLKEFPDDGEVLEITVTAISKKPTAKGGFSWGFKDEEGRWWNTFEARVGDAVSKGDSYEFVTIQNGKYTNIVGFLGDYEPEATTDHNLNDFHRSDEITDDDIPF